MSNQLIFSLFAIILGLIASTYVMKKKDSISKGKILGGICLFVLLSVVGANAIAETERYFFKYTEIYAGLDYSIYDDQPFCYGSGNDSRIISNGGIRQNLFTQEDEKTVFELNVKTTHHSCAVEQDRFVTDGAGIEISFRRVWF